MIRKRSDYWQVKVYAGRDPLTGKERYEYERARTKREAERVEAALKTKVAEGRHRGTAARTVADLVERWFEWRQGVKEISPTTLQDYRLQIDRRIIPALGRIPVQRLDVETLDTFYAGVGLDRPQPRPAGDTPVRTARRCRTTSRGAGRRPAGDGSQTKPEARAVSTAGGRTGCPARGAVRVALAAH